MSVSILDPRIPQRRQAQPQRRLWILATVAMVAFAACSSSSEPAPRGVLASSYHLRSVNGVPVPLSGPSGDVLDSGRFSRLSGDTVEIDHYSHVAGSNSDRTITRGTWVASQVGLTLILSPALASARDTAFLRDADTLTLHNYSSNVLQIEVYVAP